MRDFGVVLIGGTSNVGKSTLAQSLAAKFGWRQVSTDSLARHPGRPWKIDGRSIPDHVKSHYLSLSVGELTTEQLHHYERMWPMVATLVNTHLRDHPAARLVVEGSGIWPDHAAGLRNSKVIAMWLTASPGILRSRIFAASRHAELSGDERVLIEKFLARTERYDEIMRQAISRLSLVSIDVSSLRSPGALVDRCLRVLD